jgi:hypothetical protein
MPITPIPASNHRLYSCFWIHIPNSDQELFLTIF